MDIDWAFIGVLLTLAGFVSAYLLRFRIARWAGSLLLKESIDFARRELFDEKEEEGEDGARRVLWHPNAKLEAFAGMIAPPFVAAAIKSIKMRIPSGAPPIGPGGTIDLGAAIGLLPKRYQGIAALALPFLQKFGLTPGKPKEGETPNPFLKELRP